MNIPYNANMETNVVYVPRAEWEAQAKRIAELEAQLAQTEHLRKITAESKEHFRNCWEKAEVECADLKEKLAQVEQDARAFMELLAEIDKRVADLNYDYLDENQISIGVRLSKIVNANITKYAEETK